MPRTLHVQTGGLGKNAPQFPNLKTQAGRRQHPTVVQALMVTIDVVESHGSRDALRLAQYTSLCAFAISITSKALANIAAIRVGEAQGFLLRLPQDREVLRSFCFKASHMIFQP